MTNTCRGCGCPQEPHAVLAWPVAEGCTVLERVCLPCLSVLRHLSNEAGTISVADARLLLARPATYA